MDTKRLRNDTECLNHHKRFCLSSDILMADFSHANRTISLITNHYHLKLSPISVYHFDVDITECYYSPRSSQSNLPRQYGGGSNVSFPSHPSQSTTLSLSKSASHNQPKSQQDRWTKSIITPAEIMYELIEQNIGENQIFYDQNRQTRLYPVFDGVKNLYLNTPLFGTNYVSQEQCVYVKMHNGKGKTTYKVKIKQVSNLDLSKLCSSSFDNGIGYRDCIRAIDIILRYAPSMTRISKGDFLFPKPTEKDKWLKGKYLVCGHVQRVKPTKSGLAFLVDRSSTAFYQGCSLLDLMRELLKEYAKNQKKQDKTNNHDWLHTISYHKNNDLERVDKNIVQLEKDLKGILIEIDHTQTKRRYKIRKITRKSLQEIEFDFTQRGDGSNSEEKTRRTIQEYFLKEYNIKLEKIYLPCIDVGRDTRPIYLPPELCKVTKHQFVLHKLDETEHSKFITASTHKPAQRFELIDKIHRSIIHESRSYLDEFRIDISETPVDVEGTVLEPPKLVFGNGSLQPTNGQWSMKDQLFLTGLRLKAKEWVIVNFAPSLKNFDIKQFTETLLKYAEEKGASIGEPHFWNDGWPVNGKVNQVIKEMIEYSAEPLRMIMFAIPRGKNDTIYKDIKKYGDKKYGLNTQCIVDTNLKKCKKNGFPTLLGLLSKLYAKLGGITYRVHCSPSSTQNAIEDVKTLIVGADVTHPGDNVNFSIAAVVTSMSRGKLDYTAAVRVQSTAKREIIEDFSTMMAKLIKVEAEKLQKSADYKDTHIKNAFPERIIFYRDGVSDGQFTAVKEHELKHMREAFQMIRNRYVIDNFNPKVTFIVVQKRQKTRLLPASKGISLDPNTSNIPSGTLVTEKIVQNNDGSDFFLCSHYSKQGTSRPCHYFVLLDENNFQANELHKLTYDLCHTYVKCPKALSIPPPVQYAHQAAFRARQYLDRHPANDLTGAKEKIKINKRLSETFYYI